MGRNDKDDFELSKFDHYNSVTPSDDYSPDKEAIDFPQEKEKVKKSENNTNYEHISSTIELNSIADTDNNEETDYNDDVLIIEPNKLVDFFSRNHYRNAKITALVVAIALLVSVVVFFVYVYFSTKSDGYSDDGVNYVDDDYILEDNHAFSEMSTVDSDSLNGFLYDWYNNKGEKMFNKNVINVLLCGVENSDGVNTGVASSGRSDSMIVVSIDKKNKTIKLVSLYRDSWTYMTVPRANGTTEDYYFKLNSSYNYGGPSNLIKTIENDYKIKIDQYVAVDFSSFKKLIDAVGGIDIDVEEYEANYIRRTSYQKDFPYGENVHLTGIQALTYSRIRHCDNDGDISRTRRQRKVIKALIESAKNATNGQLVNAFKQVKDYMRTGYTQAQVLSLITQAVSHDWMKFTMSEMTLPNEEGVDSAGGYIGSQWAWAVDYPICAQKMQKFLYGKTNITLQADRLTVLDYLNGRSKSDDSSYSSDYSYTYSYNTTQSNNYDDSDDTYYYEKTTSSQYYEEPDVDDVTEENPSDTEPTEDVGGEENPVIEDNTDAPNEESE